MTKWISFLFVLLFAQSSFANENWRLTEFSDFVRIHESTSDASYFIKKANIQSIVVKSEHQNWIVFITTNEIGGLQNQVNNSNRVYRYKFLTQSRADSFATQLIELSTPKKEGPF